MKTLVSDPRRCQGARECEHRCALTWFKVPSASRSSLRVSPDDRADGAYAARFCIQCGECIAVCPVEALYRDRQGVVRVRATLCVGCMSCVGFCPYSVMFYAAEQALPFKCVACGQCVEACPHGALIVREVPEASTALWDGTLSAEPEANLDTPGRSDD